MALDIAGAVRARLAGDATLVGMLALYAGAPAVLVDPPPDDYEADILPSIIVGEPHYDEDDSDLTFDGREVILRVRVYAKHNGSSVALNAAAERVRSLLKHWTADNFSDGKLSASFVSGPVQGPTSDPSIEGRILTPRLLIKE